MLRVEEGELAVLLGVVRSGGQDVALCRYPGVGGGLRGAGQPADVVLRGEVYGLAHLDAFGDLQSLLLVVEEVPAGGCGQGGEGEAVPVEVDGGLHLPDLHLLQPVVHAEERGEVLAGGRVNRGEQVVVEADVGELLVLAQVDFPDLVVEQVDASQLGVCRDVDVGEQVVAQVEVGELRVLAQVDAGELHVLRLQSRQFGIGREVERLDAVVGADELGELRVLAQVDGPDVVPVDGEFRQVLRPGDVDGRDLRAVHPGDGLELCDALAVDLDFPVSDGRPVDGRGGPIVVGHGDFLGFHGFPVAPVNAELVPGFRGRENQFPCHAVHFGGQGDGRGGLLCLGGEPKHGKYECM